MALLKPNYTYTANGVTVNEKIIPDGTRWTDAAKAKAAGFSANALYKKQAKLSGGTGKVQSVTIHNTNDLPGTYDDGEQYTRATWPNQNMNSSRVHFYTDDVCAWQNLKAGTGMTPNDPEGSAEVSWHSGDGSVATGGNMTSISIEVIMNDTAEHDAKAYDNGARLAAWLLWKHGLPIDKLVTHTYWVNKMEGKTFADPDTQSTNPIYGKKWCPTYIFASSNAATAKKNWQAFKALVKTYLDALSGTTPAPTPDPGTSRLYRVRKAWTDSKSQIGAFKVLDNAKALADKNPGFAVFDETGKQVYPEAAPATPYRVQVTISDLYIRSEPRKGSAAKGFIAPGIYTIIEERPGDGSASGWGKLKSGAGWIALDYARKL